MAHNRLAMIDQTTLEFYEKNKGLTWTMPAAPGNLTSDYELANWVMNNMDIGWLELDLELDINCWKNECTVADEYYVNHRGDGHPGWNSCCVHGIAVDQTGSWNLYGYENESDVLYDWTELSQRTPSITKFWQDAFPIERYRRIRFMELTAGGYISPHSDMPGKLNGECPNINILDHGAPINIAIIHPTDCHMVVEGFGTVPWSSGKAIIVNIRHHHSVINFSKEQRVHMIAHGWYGNRLDEFCQLVAKSYRKQYAIQG